MKRLFAPCALSAAALLLAVAPASAAPQTATIGNTTGTPSTNVAGCSASITCTFVPYANAGSPELQVPFDGTVTSFSVNTMSTSATPNIALRVLRPAGGGQFTGAGTSPSQTLSNPGINTFTVSVPVKKGDVIGLDNDSSAIMFDTSDPVPLTAYYELPSLSDGSTAAPNHNTTGYRLLLSAVVQQATTIPPTAPQISNASVTSKRFRVAKQSTAVSAKAPKGTTFKFTLSAAAKLQIALTRLDPGRRKGSKCLAPSPLLLKAKHCKRHVNVGTLTRASEPQGADTLAFTGRLGAKKLKPGRYLATLTASNAAGTSSAVSLKFTVVK